MADTKATKAPAPKKQPPKRAPENIREQYPAVMAFLLTRPGFLATEAELINDGGVAPDAIPAAVQDGVISREYNGKYRLNPVGPAV